MTSLQFAMTKPVEDFVLGLLATNPDTDSIDQAVWALLGQHDIGVIDEASVRSALAAFLRHANIPSQVASTLTLSGDGKDDVADGILDVLERRIIDNSDGKGYCLERGADKSFCGWARTYASRVRDSEARRVRNRINLNGAPLDPTEHDFTTARTRTGGGTLTATTETRRLDAEDLEDLVAAATKGARTVSRRATHCDLVTIRLGVVAPLRPLRAGDREEMLTQVLADPWLAFRSLRLFAERTHGERFDRPTQSDIDGRFLALWDDQTEASLHLLLDLGPKTVHMLVENACSMLPRPPKDVLNRIRSAIRGSGPRTPEWRNVASALADAWIAGEFLAYSEYSSMPNETREKIEVGHLLHRTSSTMRLRGVLAFPGQPLGATEDEVLENVRDLVAPILVNLARQRYEAAAETVAATYAKKHADAVREGRTSALNGRTVAAVETRAVTLLPVARATAAPTSFAMAEAA